MAVPHRDKIKELRLELTMTRPELAEAAGFSYQHLYNIEEGFVGASDEFLAKLANFFSWHLNRKIHLSDLVGAPESDSKPAAERRASSARSDELSRVSRPRPSRSGSRTPTDGVMSA